MPELKKKLEKIISICRDGYEGYQTAADNLESPELTTLFYRLAQQRKIFIEELKKESKKLSMDLEESGSFKGFFHRTWINIRDFFSSSENKAIISEAIRGENAALDAYNEVLNNSVLPEFLKRKLQEQHQLVEAAIANLYDFERKAA